MMRWISCRIILNAQKDAKYGGWMANRLSARPHAVTSWEYRAIHTRSCLWHCCIERSARQGAACEQVGWKPWNWYSYSDGGTEKHTKIFHGPLSPFAQWTEKKCLNESKKGVYIATWQRSKHIWIHELIINRPEFPSFSDISSTMVYANFISGGNGVGTSGELWFHFSDRHCHRAKAQLQLNK